jgi:hypothetical protein
MYEERFILFIGKVANVSQIRGAFSYDMAPSKVSFLF